MNADVKKLWLKALRSGEYKQGVRTLRDVKDQYCCLGVLCDLHAKAFNNDWALENTYTYTYLGSSTYLPNAVIEWAWADTFNDRELAKLNDTCFNFDYIAGFIKDNL